jgi:hypothetical protein
MADLGDLFGSSPATTSRTTTRRDLGDLFGSSPATTSRTTTRRDLGDLAKGAFNFFTQSEQRAGKSLGQSLYVMTGGQKQVDRITKAYMDDGDRLMKHASTITNPDRKAEIIHQARQSYQAAGATSEDIIGHIREKKEMIGDAAGVLLDALSFGTYGKAVQGVAQTAKLMKAAPNIIGGTQKATTFVKGFLQSAKTGMKAAAPVTTGYGLAQGLQDNKSTLDIIKTGLVSGAVGTVAGGLLSGLVGGLSARAAKLRADKASGLAETTAQYTPTPSGTKAATPILASGKTTPKQNAQLQDAIKAIKGKGEIKERGFITTMKESARTPQAVKDIIKGSYVPKTNTSLANDARTLVMADPAAAEAIALNPRNAVDVEVGNQLMAHYQSIGNHAKVAQIGEALASSGTDLGQAVQAFSNYDKTTPQGAIRYATSVIKKHNDLGKNVVKLTDDHTKTIYDAAAKIQELPIGRERNIATHQLMEEVNNLIPSSFADKAITVWKAGLLTSLRTHERNLLGNTLQAGAEVAKDVPGTMADVLMSTRTGQRTTTLTTKGMGAGAKKGWQAAIDIVRTGYDPEQSIEKFDIRHVTWRKNPLEQGLKKFTDVVFRTLGAEDKVFLNATYARSLYDQAGAAAINAGKRGDRAFIEALVKSPTDDMMLNATKDSMYATFHDKNMLSTVINKAKNAMSAHEWSKIGGEIVAPFTGVPSSILGKVVDYSPVGLANGIRHAGIVLTKNVPTLQRQAAQEIGRGTIGTGIFGLGAYLAKRGLLTGQPKNPEEARQWELENKKHDSVFVAGEWRSIQSVGPQALVILAGGKAAQELSKGGAGLGSFAGGVGKDFLGQSFLAGVQGPLNAITDPTRYGQSYLKSQLSSVVPNLVKDTARAFDPNQRQTNSVLEGLMSSVPGLRNKLLPKRDALGNVLTNDVPGIGSYVDLFTSSQPKKSPIIDELTRLNEAGTPATPSKINPKMTINKQKITLSPAGLNDLQAASSGELQTKLNELVQSRLYKMLSDDQRVKAIDKVVGDVRDNYKDNLPPILSVESSYAKSPDSSSNVFDLVARYGEGFIKDPAQTLRALFTAEHLRKVVGNATILERKDFLSLLDKGDRATVVDHIIPLTLGGTNDESNLRVISKDENQKKATVEVMLFNLLKQGTITRQEAQRRIRDWRYEL